MQQTADRRASVQLAGYDMTPHGQALVSAADQAAARRNYREARRLLDAATKQGADDVDVWLRLSAMCRAESDMRAALEATAGALAKDPLHFLALLLHAKLLEALGEESAGEAYGRALAQRPKGEVPAHVLPTVEHASKVYGVHQQAQNALLAAQLDPLLNGIPEEQKRRIDRFRTNIVRITRPYHSEPTHFFYPGLIEREFYDRDEFPWLAELESATGAIAADLERVLASRRKELVPYVQHPRGAPLRQWQPLNHSLDWSAIHLINNGSRVEANAKHCEATLDALARLPQPEIPGSAPNAMFSLLAPGAHIPPHTGITNTRLVCHLPLIVPPHCWFRVGADRREWRRGEAWVFDDTIEHEAANESNALRVILIFDVWHPALAPVEREAITRAVTIDHRDLSGAL